MKIYRVEHMSLVSQHGHPTGPYGVDSWYRAEHGDDACSFDDEMCTHFEIEELCGITPTHRPGPWSDGGLDMYSVEDPLFGFESMAMLNFWFEEDLVWLRNIGYVVGVYEVADAYVSRGMRQLVFSYTMASRVDELPVPIPTFAIDEAIDSIFE